jgi:hypothetical protein
MFYKKKSKKKKNQTELNSTKLKTKVPLKKNQEPNNIGSNCVGM